MPAAAKRPVDNARLDCVAIGTLNSNRQAPLPQDGRRWSTVYVDRLS
jgi:hypothetical protein